MSNTLLQLPLSEAPSLRHRRQVELVMARAIRLALSPHCPDEEAMSSLLAAADDHPLLLTAALGRLERAAISEPSRTVGRAVALVRAARDLTCTRR